MSVWDVLVDQGNKGLTAGGIKAKTTFYHPQVLKDLLDCKLVMRLPRKQGNEYVYVADRKGRGIIPRSVRVEIELIEDEEGRFFVNANLVGQTGKPVGGTRVIAKRGVNFVIPLEQELRDKNFTKPVKAREDTVVDTDYVNVITNTSQMIIEQ